MNQKPQPPKNLAKKRIGKIGEKIAARYLVNHGYRILAANFSIRYGELDLVAVKNETLIFVEVKTRVGREFGLPEEAVTPRKLREITSTAAYFKNLHPELPDALRIDVIAIELNPDETVKNFKHIENVTS